MSERIKGGCSLHDEEMPELCGWITGGVCADITARVVDCCKRKPDTDVLECPRCGKQWETRCTFDEDMS